MFKNKRYKDLFDQYIYRGEPTPLSLGTVVICGLCFLFLIIATFTQFNINLPWNNPSEALLYSPIIPIMIFNIYILGRNYSILLFLTYLLIGLLIWPIFLFGGGLDYIYNYTFGYFTGFLVAIILSGNILLSNHTIKSRLLSALVGVISIHITGLIYCVILAIFKVINFSFIYPIFQAITLKRFLYDLSFSILIILIAPYVKNVFWICMKPKMNRKKIKRNINY